MVSCDNSCTSKIKISVFFTTIFSPFFREGNENYRIFQNQQQLQRTASVSTLSYENPIYETDNEYQMYESPKNESENAVDNNKK